MEGWIEANAEPLKEVEAELLTKTGVNLKITWEDHGKIKGKGIGYLTFDYDDLIESAQLKLAGIDNVSEFGQLVKDVLTSRDDYVDALPERVSDYDPTILGLK